MTGVHPSDPTPRLWPDAMVAAVTASGVPPRKVIETLAAHPDPDRALRHLPPLRRDTPIPPAGFVIVLGDPDYPATLAAAPNPPRILFGRGNRHLLTGPGIAITGTRQPTSYGTLVAEATASAISYAGAPLISGGAPGVDQIAAVAAIQYQTPNVVVLATGADQALDATQRRFLDDVLTYGGVIVSEHPFGTGTDQAPGYTPAPLRARLAARNRIITGLGALTVAVAGSLNSGTSGAAWTAFATGRPVVVARPRPHALHLPDTALPAALAHETPAGVARLRAAGCPATLAADLADRAPLAHAAATSPDDLTQVISTLWMLSPDRTATHTGVAVSDRLPA